MGLTERALVHAHREQCADCQAERASPPLAVSSLPRIEPSGGVAVSAAAAHLIERVRFAIPRVAPSLISLRSSLLRAFQATVLASSGTAGAGATRLLAFLSWLRLVVSTSLTVSTRAGAGAIGAARARLIRVAGLLPTLLMLSARAAGDLVGHARFVSARVLRLLLWPGSALLGACQVTAHAASEASAAGATRIFGLLSRLGARVAISSGGLAGTVGVAGRTGAMRILDVLFRAGARVPVLVAPSARAVGRVVVMAPARAWAYPKACAGVASLVVLIAALVVLGPPHWPDTRVPLRDVRLPVDRTPAEPAVVAPLAHPAPPAPAAALQPVPAPRVAAPEAHAAVPAPVRRSAVSAPQPSTEATQNAETSDPAAAIDWLLQGSARRHAERP
jgi:hypothetical protein